MVDIICIKLLKALRSLRNGMCKWIFIIIHILDHIDSISTSFKGYFHKTSSFVTHRDEKYAFIMLYMFNYMSSKKFCNLQKHTKCSNLELMV